MAVVTSAMPGSLYYYLPRSDGATKRVYVNQTLLFLSAAGVIAGWAVSSWNPWLPEKIRGLAQHEAIVPAFVLLWVITSLLDMLPTVDEQVAWQAKAKVGLATLRAAALSLAAFLTRELEPVLLVLLGFAAFKVALLLGYVAKHHGLRGPILRRDAFADQLRYVFPFWAAGMLYGLQAQADQWVAAALFSVAMFASFSIAAVLGPLVGLFRQAVSHAFMPSMSRMEAAGDLKSMMEMNARANAMVGMLLLPMLGFVFAFAEDLVSAVYTAAYIDAAPVMRVYIIGMAALVVELSSVLQLLRQGMFSLGMNVAVLAVAVPLSWFGGVELGLAGAAAGSVTAPPSRACRCAASSIGRASAAISPVPRAPRSRRG